LVVGFLMSTIQTAKKSRSEYDSRVCLQGGGFSCSRSEIPKKGSREVNHSRKQKRGEKKAVRFGYREGRSKKINSERFRKKKHDPLAEA